MNDLKAVLLPLLAILCVGQMVVLSEPDGWEGSGPRSAALQLCPC